ncbi:MAG: RagB/SusD family nutrient uptake outer membrane protein [Bacteroidales bacterium]|jgi:hypothetical protein|nr:RagB/SusD family nutrient uptake outer membrane protein [Bacteroidales bacterium]
MKKGNKTLAALALCACMTAGCSLVHESYSEISTDIYPSNAEEADAMILANVYQVFNIWHVFNPDVTGWWTMSNIVSDQFDSQYSGSYIGFDLTAQDNHESGTGGYPFLDEDNYTPLYLRSRFLSKMLLTKERIKNVPMTDARKKRMNAEIHCGMGFLAFLAYDLYGPVSLPTLEILQNPAADLAVRRATEEEMQQYIESNLAEALKDDALPARCDGAEYGRFTRGLAFMVLFKYCMLMGGMKEKESAGSGAPWWEKAETAGRELLKPEYGYALEDDYNALFSEAGEKNREVIFSGIADPAMASTYVASVIPSDFDTPGQNLQKWGVFKLRWDFYHTFEEHDLRTQRIITEYVSTAEGHPVRSEANDATQENIRTGLRLGALPVKFDYSTTIGSSCPVDVPMYRFADALTLLAEAIVRNAGTVTTEAVGYLNDVRRRAFGAYHTPKQPSDFAGAEDFLEQLLMERAHELWFEGHQRQDQIRCGKFIEACMEKGRKGYLPIARIEHMRQQTVPGKYDFERFPVPLSAIREGRGVILQNPGY